jgi:hypothetical protein
MTELPIFKSKTVDYLWERVPSNLSAYEYGDFKRILQSPAAGHEERAVASVYVDFEALQSLKTASGTNEAGRSDAHNARVVYSAIQGITPDLATDERVWAALTHGQLKQFTFDRHISQDDTEEKIAQIRRRFFARGGDRGIHRENSLARLWWYAYICEKNSQHSLQETLEAVLTKTDFNSALFQRPTPSRVNSVFSAISNIAVEEYRKSDDPRIMKRENYRSWFKEINRFGGIKLYATRGVTELEGLFRNLMPK